MPDDTTRDPITGEEEPTPEQKPTHDTQAFMTLRSNVQLAMAFSAALFLVHLLLALLVDCLWWLNAILAILHLGMAAYSFRTLRATSDPITGEEEPTAEQKETHDTGG